MLTRKKKKHEKGENPGFDWHRWKIPSLELASLTKKPTKCLLTMFVYKTFSTLSSFSILDSCCCCSSSVCLFGLPHLFGLLHFLGVTSSLWVIFCWWCALNYPLLCLVVHLHPPKFTCEAANSQVDIHVILTFV